MSDTFRIRGAIERVDRRDGRYYRWEGERYYSVTTIIDGGTPKWPLINWAKKFTAEYAVEHFDAFKALVDDDPIAATDWLKRASTRMTSVAGELGSAVHEAAEAYVLGRPYPPWTIAVRPYMENALLPFLETWKPEIIAIEAPVFSKKHRYAGTLDNIMVIDGVRLLSDYKSGKAIYPEVGLQEAAYRFSETYIGLPDGEMEPTPEVDGCIAIHLRPDGYEIRPIRADRQVFDAFLFVREVFRWTEETSGTIVGPKVQDSARVCVRDGCEHHALLHGPRGCMQMVESKVSTAPGSWPNGLNVAAGINAPGAVLAVVSAPCECAGFRAVPLKREVDA